MSLLPFFQWLAKTPGSQALLGSETVWPLVESFHVWTLPVFAGLTAILDLRLLGVVMRRVPVSEVTRRLLPWMTAGFVVMVLTGMLLLYAKPVRTYQSIWFRGKVVLLILAGLNVWIFNSGVYKKIADWDLTVPPRPAMRAGAVSLVLWAAIIMAGRMIAYNWYDCDKPQAAIVNLLAGCVVEPGE